MDTFIYTYASYEDERSLRALEMRSLFGCESETSILESAVKIDPSRSPFMKERIGVIYEGDSLQDLLVNVATLHVPGETFKVLYVKNGSVKETFERRRAIEREVGLQINGVVDLPAASAFIWCHEHKW